MELSNANKIIKSYKMGKDNKGKKVKYTKNCVCIWQISAHANLIPYICVQAQSGNWEIL